MTTLDEYCPNCKKLGLTSEIKIYDRESEAETKIAQIQCANNCGYRGQRDLTQTIISANFVAKQR